MPLPPPTKDRFNAAMPRIPGVSVQPQEKKQDARATPEPPATPPGFGAGEWDGSGVSPYHRRFILLAAGIGVAVALLWWAYHAKHGAPKAGDPAVISSSDAPPPIVDDSHPTDSTEDVISGVTAVATAEELAKPWSAKKFTFVDAQSHERVPAMIVRLPGENGERKEAYWAFSLNAPYKTCQLDYVQDLNQLATRYSYRAGHPMVVAACDGTIYDPLRLGTTPSGAWVRGDIAAGPGIRPPISIEVRLQGSKIFADRIE